MQLPSGQMLAIVLSAAFSLNFNQLFYSSPFLFFFFLFSFEELWDPEGHLNVYYWGLSMILWKHDHGVDQWNRTSV